MSALNAKSRAWVYILASRKNGTLYVGVTTDLAVRLWQHRQGYFAGFTKLHQITTLVHAEEYRLIRRAVARERALKGWRRARKVALIEEANPDWDDLAANWLREGLDPSLRSG